MNKILCIQNRQMGDVLMCTPALKILKNNYPDAIIHFLTESLGEQVLRNNKNVDEIILVPRKIKASDYLSLIKRLREESYDAVIDFFSNPKSAYITYLTGSKRRCGFANWSRSWAFNKRLKYSREFTFEYAAKTKSRLLELIDINIDELPAIEMDTNDHARAFADKFWSDIGITAEERIIAFCPVSRRDYKIWEPEKYAFIADALAAEKNTKIWMVYGPGENHLIEPVLRAMKNKAIADYPMPDIPQLRALFARCALYFGNDGGNKHIAIASGLPTVTIFRQLNPENWTPPESDNHITFAEGNPGQGPLGSIKKEDVLNEIKKLLGIIR